MPPDIQSQLERFLAGRLPGAGSDAAALERACADAPADAARAALGAHLGPQAVRNVLPRTRSKLNEISKG